MSRKTVGSVRRSSLVSTFGVGSLLPMGDDSVMIRGLADWPKGDVIDEPRLASSLQVNEFRSPPTGMRIGDVPAVRFPEWVFCTACRKLGPWWEIVDDEAGGRRCAACLGTTAPSRFVACCANGHISDFPYRAWVHGDGRVQAKGHALQLVARGHTSSLDDILIRCSCGKSRSMGGAFKGGALRAIQPCFGKRPWLDTDDNGCVETLRTLQRGSANVWFAMTRSAISIPSIANAADMFVRRRFADASADASSEDLANLFTPPEGLTKEDVRRAIDRMRAPAATHEAPSERDLRAEEYRALVQGSASFTDESMFSCQEIDVADIDLPTTIAQISRVGRLREVRALTGFTRLVPAAEADGPHVAPLDDTGGVSWRPAVEVLGEGVFVRLDLEALGHWAHSPFALGRTRRLLANQAQAGERSMAARMDVSPKSLLLHSLAHVLIDEMALGSGYPAASIRERIYDEEDQAGVLVYTATADSAGSLGGLASLSDANRFTEVLSNGMERARWCTADPVCSESSGSGLDGMNLAACHACLLLPEVSCERFNLGLDRATLVGLADDVSGGFFSNLHT